VRSFGVPNLFIQRTAISSDGKTLATFAETHAPVRDAKGRPTGVRYFVDDKCIRLWDLATGKELGRFGKRGLWLRLLAFSATGSRLVGASYETIKAWDVPSGRPVSEAKVAPRQRISETAIDLSPDGKWLFTSDREMVIRVWDVATGKLVCR